MGVGDGLGVGVGVGVADDPIVQSVSNRISGMTVLPVSPFAVPSKTVTGPMFTGELLA